MRHSIVLWRSTEMSLRAAEAIISGLPLVEMEVSTEFVASPPYRAGYFDTFILADRVSIRGMGKRVRTSGLGVALVGSRERTPEREKEMFYQPAGRGVYAPFAAVAEFDSEPRSRSSHPTDRSKPQKHDRHGRWKRSP